MQVKIDHKADWWLGRLDDEWFRFLEASVRDEWGITPLRIREGGVSLLEARPADAELVDSPYHQFRILKRSLVVMHYISLSVRVP